MRGCLMMLMVGAMVLLAGLTAEARTTRTSVGVQENMADNVFDYLLKRQLAQRSATPTVPESERIQTEPTRKPGQKGGSPAEVCAAVRRQVRYVSDESLADQWKAAAATWDSGQGDCEDFAVCVQRLCEDRGVQAEVYRLYPANGKLGHVIVVGQWRGQTWMSSNGSYREVKSMEAAVRQVAQSMGWNPADVEVVEGAPATRADSVLRQYASAGP